MAKSSSSWIRILAILALTLAVWVSAAHAGAQFKISDGVTTVTVLDNGPGDSDPKGFWEATAVMIESLAASEGVEDSLLLAVLSGTSDEEIDRAFLRVAEDLHHVRGRCPGRQLDRLDVPDPRKLLDVVEVLPVAKAGEIAELRCRRLPATRRSR